MPASNDNRRLRKSGRLDLSRVRCPSSCMVPDPADPARQVPAKAPVVDTEGDGERIYRWRQCSVCEAVFRTEERAA